METNLWTKHYNGPANGYDAGQAIAVDANGNAYVTGNHTTATGLDCATLKYSTDGDLLWTASYDGPDNGGDVLISIALDDLANVYVSGFVASGGRVRFRNNQLRYHRGRTMGAIIQWAW